VSEIDEIIVIFFFLLQVLRDEYKVSEKSAVRVRNQQLTLNAAVTACDASFANG
jgi:hypothetical protein